MEESKTAKEIVEDTLGPKVIWSYGGVMHVLDGQELNAWEIVRMIEEYAKPLQSHITKLEAENVELKADVNENEEKQGIQELYTIGLETINKRLEARNKDLEEQLPKWISVKDRLPEKGVSVLVCYNNRIDWRANYWTGKRWEVTPLMPTKVTYWMPMPLNPKTIAEQALNKK